MMNNNLLKVALASILLAAPLSAKGASVQNAPAPHFVPWEVDERTAQAIENTLGEIPLKYSLALYNFMNQREDRAILDERQKAAAAARGAPSLAHPPSAPPLPKAPAPK